MTVRLLGEARNLTTYATQIASSLPKDLEVLVLHADSLLSNHGASSESSAKAVGFLRAEFIQAAVEFNIGGFKLDRAILEDIAGSFSSFPMNNARMVFSAATPDPHSDVWGPIICAGGFKKVTQAPDQAVIVLPPSAYSGVDFLCQTLSVPWLISDEPRIKTLVDLEPNGYFLAQELARLYLYTATQDRFRTSYEFEITSKIASDVCSEAEKTELVNLMMPARVLSSLLSEMSPSAVAGWNALALQSENQDVLTYQSDVCAALELRFRVSEALYPSTVALPTTREQIVREAFASVGTQGAASAFENLLVRAAVTKPLIKMQALEEVVLRNEFQWPETRELALLSQKAFNSLRAHIL